MSDDVMHASGRLPGMVLVATATLTLGLFVLHPAEHATDFTGFVREEAANRAMDLVVHGGFGLILGCQLACYAMFSAWLGGSGGGRLRRWRCSRPERSCICPGFSSTG
jgi:hypothetical protein